MKKLLIFFIFIGLHLQAQSNYELKLYEKILPTLFHNRPIKLFVDNETKIILKHSDIFHIVDYCDNDTVVLVGNFRSIPKGCKDNPLFATSYRSFKDNENAFGAYYWRKGRPQLFFKESILNKFNVQLPKSLKKYGRK